MRTVARGLGFGDRGSVGRLAGDHERATHSNQAKARFRQVLTACALAPSDPVGWFTPRQVRAPLSGVMERPVGIDAFNDTLREFTEARRGGVLQRKGVARVYRYRYRDPAMQPCAIMQGVRAGHLDAAARAALASPDPPTLFPDAV